MNAAYYLAKAGGTRARSAAWLMRTRGRLDTSGLRILFYHRVANDRDELAVAPEPHDFVALKAKTALPAGNVTLSLDYDGTFSTTDSYGAFVETEGVSLVLERSAATRFDLAYIYPCRLITLTVHSSLDAIGFVARITSALAAAWGRTTAGRSSSRSTTPGGCTTTFGSNGTAAC